MVEVQGYAHPPLGQTRDMLTRTDCCPRYAPCGQRAGDAALPWSQTLSTSTVYRDPGMPKLPLPSDVWPDAPIELGYQDMTP